MGIVINEDGTKVSLPNNPLDEKWKKDYPKMNNCDKYDKEAYINTACLDCADCPKGAYFKVPEIDRKLYLEYLKECKEYFEEHNPGMNKPKVYKKEYKSDKE